jgi:hypothetical protein
MNPEVKIVVRVHENALATAPTADDLKKLLGFEPSHFVVERRTIPVERRRAPEIAAAATLWDQVEAWGKATEQQLDGQRLQPKVAEVAG